MWGNSWHIMSHYDYALLISYHLINQHSWVLRIDLPYPDISIIFISSRFPDKEEKKCNRSGSTLFKNCVLNVELTHLPVLDFTASISILPLQHTTEGITQKKMKIQHHWTLINLLGHMKVVCSFDIAKYVIIIMFTHMKFNLMVLAKSWKLHKMILHVSK